MGGLLSTNLLYNCPVWPLIKADVLWRLTIYYWGLNKEYHLEHHQSLICFHSGWKKYNVIRRPLLSDLPYKFFLFLISKKSQLKFAFMWEGSQSMFARLPQGYLNSPTYCLNLVRRDLDFRQVLSVLILHWRYHDIIKNRRTSKDWRTM